MINTLDLFMDWLIIRIASLLHVTWCRRMMKKKSFSLYLLTSDIIVIFVIFRDDAFAQHSCWLSHTLIRGQKNIHVLIYILLFSYWLSNLKNHDYKDFSDHSIFLFEISRQIEKGVFGCFLMILLHASGNGDVTATIILKFN